MAGKSRNKAKAKGKVKPKRKAKAKPKTYGCRVAVYFSKAELPLLERTRALAAKRKVGLNRLVMDGLRTVHQLEGDVHYEAKISTARSPNPGVAH